MLKAGYLDPENPLLITAPTSTERQPATRLAVRRDNVRTAAAKQQQECFDLLPTTPFAFSIARLAAKHLAVTFGDGDPAPILDSNLRARLDDGIALAPLGRCSGRYLNRWDLCPNYLQSLCAFECGAPGAGGASGGRPREAGLNRPRGRSSTGGDVSTIARGARGSPRGVESAAHRGRHMDDHGRVNGPEGGARGARVPQMGSFAGQGPTSSVGSASAGRALPARERGCADFRGGAGNTIACWECHRLMAVPAGRNRSRSSCSAGLGRISAHQSTRSDGSFSSNRGTSTSPAAASPGTSPDPRLPRRSCMPVASSRRRIPAGRSGRHRSH